MRYYPSSEDEQKDAAELNAEPWMLECLRLNPSYCSWGPGEDYMPSPKSDDSGGWAASVRHATWKEFGPWTLDELNVVPHFYFNVERATENCAACDCSGYNTATKRIADDFYDFAGTGRGWHDKITQDECDALVEAGRLMAWKKGEGWSKVPRTADEVNAANRRGGVHNPDLDHDAINRFILVETRANRLGVYGKCEVCGGKGYVYTASAAKLGLVLWVLHPRKGASRGVEIEEITKDDLPAALAFLREAAKQNAAMFAAVVAAQ